MRIITTADWQIMPWKNGRGQTTQLAVWPEDAGFDTFAWRLSMATAQEDGPFSVFTGIDRTLLILEGEGVTLHRPQQADVILHRTTAPFAFAGEESVTMTLLDGPVLDFNVMTRRALCRHTVSILHPQSALSLPAEPCLRILFCRSGSVVTDKALLQPRDAILLTPGEQLSCRTHTGKVPELLLIRIVKAA